MRAVFDEALFIGNADEARDVRLLYDARIAAVVDLAANETPAVLGRDHIYFRIPIVDGDGNDDWLLELAILIVARLIQTGTRTLLACSAGMSRSPGIAAASVAVATNETPENCLARIVATGPNDVSPVLWEQIVRVYDQAVSGPGAAA